MTTNINNYGSMILVNKSPDTTIQDTQHQYADTITAVGAGQEKLTQLLNLIQHSSDLNEPDRQTATNEVHALIRDIASPEAGSREAVRTRLQALGETLSRTAAIAAPATEIIASLMPLFS